MGLLWGLTEVLEHFGRLDLRDYLGAQWWLAFFVLPALLALLDSPARPEKEATESSKGARRGA